jgi:FSR family fosmidomycin resistance protein-like MFS transporter
LDAKIPVKGATTERSGFRLFFSGSILLFVIAHFTHHLINALHTPLLPFIRDDLQLNYTQAGFVLSAFSLSYGLASLPAGWLTDHIGPRIMITISIIGVAVAGVMVGLSSNYVLLLMALILMGILGGGYHPSAPPLVMAAVEPKNRSKALGFHMIGGSFSHFVAPVLGGAIAVTWGWRYAYFSLAVPMIIFGIIFFIVIGRINNANGLHGAAYQKEAKADERIKPLFGMGRIVAFILFSTIIHALSTTIISFLTVYLVDRFGVDKLTAAQLLSLIYLAGVWASPLGGYLADRFGQLQVILLVSLFSGPLVYLFNLAPYGIAIYALLLLIGMVGPMRNPVAEGYIASNTPVRRRSTVLGFYYFGNMESGALLTPVVGYLLDNAPEGVSKFPYAFTIVAICMLVASVAFLVFFWGKREKKSLNPAK